METVTALHDKPVNSFKTNLAELELNKMYILTKTGKN